MQSNTHLLISHPELIKKHTLARDIISNGKKHSSYKNATTIYLSNGTYLLENYVRAFTIQSQIPQSKQAV